jgi:hypothetical protein
MVIHSIFDAWHYEILWTYALTRLLWYTCDFVCWILYITLHTTNLKESSQMHFIAHSHVRSEVHSWSHSIAHSQPAWLYAPNCSRWHTPSLFDLRSEVSSQDAPKYTLSSLPSTPLSTFPSTHPGMPSRTLPIALDGTLPGCLTVRSQVSSQDALKHTPKQALKYTPNCTEWHSQPAWLYAPK